MANISANICVRCPPGSMSEARSTSAQACLPQESDQESDKRTDSTWQIIGQVSLGLLAGVVGIICLVVNRRLRTALFSRISPRKATEPQTLHCSSSGQLTETVIEVQQLEEAQQRARQSGNFDCQCPTFQACREFAEYYFCDEGGVSKSTFDQDHDICYCSERCAAGIPGTAARGSRPYGLPKGWCGLGLAIDMREFQRRDVWVNWDVAFHGTKKNTAVEVLKHDERKRGARAGGSECTE